MACPRAQYDGELEVAGLQNPVRVVRDEYAMPYIYAESLADGLLAEGFVMAQDRLFIMDLFRYLASGRLASIAGEGMLAQDRLFRTVGLRRIAADLEQRLSPQARATFAAFTQGVAAYVDTGSATYPFEYSILGKNPDPWTLLDTLTLFVYLNWNFSGNVGEEILAQRLVERLGSARAQDLFPVHEALPPGLVYDPAATAMRSCPPPCLPRQVAGGEPGAPPTTRPFGADPLLAALARAAGTARLGGSNAWVTGAAKSAGGHPILASDPHGSGNMIPVPFYPVAVMLPEVRFAGITVIGVPGIQTGRNNWLAWGFTNDNADQQDLFIETLNPADPHQYLEGGQWTPFTEWTEQIDVKAEDGTVSATAWTIRETPRGPLVTELFPGVTAALSFRWYLRDLLDGNLGLDEAMVARTPEDFLAGLAKWPGFTQNTSIAHKDGWFAWQMMGHVPVRAGHAGLFPIPAADAAGVWNGAIIPFAEMPHLFSPEQGWSGSANHWGLGASYPYLYATTSSGPYRVLRMKEELDARATWSVQDHRNLQLDTVSILARRLVPAFAAALAAAGTAELDEVVTYLSAWDFRADVDSVGATLWNAIYRQTLRETFRDELGDDLLDAYLGQTYFFQERFEQMLAKSDAVWFDDVSTAGLVETRDEIIARAAGTALVALRGRLGEDMAAWQWGDLHTLYFEHPAGTAEPERSLLGDGPYPFEGDGETLDRGAYAFAGDSFAVAFNAAMRMVVDLGDDCSVLGSVTTGVSGRAGFEHYKDQVAAYLSGEGVRWWFCDEQIEAHKVNELMLLPASQAAVPAVPMAVLLGLWGVVMARLARRRCRGRSSGRKGRV